MSKFIGLPMMMTIAILITIGISWDSITNNLTRLSFTKLIQNETVNARWHFASAHEQQTTYSHVISDINMIAYYEKTRGKYTQIDTTTFLTVLIVVCSRSHRTQRAGT
jgi:hypothetical protein